MLASLIPLETIIHNAETRKQELIEDNETWLGSVISVQFTQEEYDNLKALAQKYPTLQVLNEDLNKI